MKIKQSFIAITAAAVATVSSATTPAVLSANASAVDGRPIVEGTTNLPEGFELMLTVSRSANSYMAQDKFKVRNSHFQSAQFTDKGGPLLPGKYKIELTGSIAGVQDQSVQNQLGANYANYSGHLIKRGKFGTVLSYETSFTVPGQTSSAADQAARKSAAEDRLAWIRKSCAEIPIMAEAISKSKMRQAQTDKVVRKCLADNNVRK